METEPRRSSGDFGISTGLVFSALLIIVQIIVDFVLTGSSQSDIVLWLVRIAIYFVAGLIAANSQYQNPVDLDEPLVGVSNAGRGAAMIVCISFWAYLVIRSVVRDDPAMFAYLGIVPAVCLSVVDFFLAVVLGGSAGGVIVKQHEHQVD